MGESQGNKNIQSEKTSRLRDSMTTFNRFTWIICAGALGALTACGGTSEDANTSDSGSASDGQSSTTSEPSTSGGGNSGTTEGETTITGGETTANDNNTTTDATTTGAFTCPLTEPAVGSACAQNGQLCQFENCVAPAYRDDHDLMCVQGAWAITGLTTCELTGTECPNALPYRGQACDPAATPGPCTSIDACGAQRALYCAAGIWDYADADSLVPASTSATVGSATVGSTSTTGAIPPAQCPVNPPVLGTTCCPTDYPQWCDYSTSSSTVVVTSSGTTTTGATTTGAITTGVTTTGATTTAATTTGAVATSTSGSSTVVAVAAAATAVGTAVSTTGLPTGTTGATTGVVPLPTAQCVACGANMLWELSTLCP